MDQKTEALYLINGDRFLHLRENGAGVGFATYDCANGAPLESGQISKQNLPPDGRNAIPAARNWYLFELSSDDRKVIQEVSLQHLDTIPQSGVRRRRIWDDPTIPRDDVRLINSHYDDLYRVLNHSVIQVDRSDGSSYTARVEHLDDYHFDLGEYGNVYHICQFGEMMERTGSTAYPEIQTQDEQGAWELGGKGYLSVQSCEDGWDYTLYHSDYSVMDGGQIDAPELTIQEVREQILEAHHMEKGRRVLKDYDLIMAKAAEMELLKENIYTEYMEEIVCYCKKTDDTSGYSKERQRWLGSQYRSSILALQQFPIAFLQGKWDLCEKLFQWLLPSRFLLILYITICAVAMTFLEWPLATKWYALLAVLFITFLMAMPEGEISRKFRSAFWSLPILVVTSSMSHITRIFKRKKKRKAAK